LKKEGFTEGVYLTGDVMVEGFSISLSSEDREKFEDVWAMG